MPDRMPSWDAVQPCHVRQAAAEYDELSQGEFLTLLRLRESSFVLLIIAGKASESKAVLGVAYKRAPASRSAPMTSAEASKVRRGSCAPLASRSVTCTSR
jgi:hypothetical protein